MDKIIAIRNYLRRKHGKVHMLGICGVGMAGLAFLLKKHGFNVSGCDKTPNRLAGWLRKRNIPVYSGHDASHVAGADWLVRSTAVPNNTPELRAARKAGKKIFRRGMVLAEMISADDSICVCGTHGKTTTTAMIAQLLKKSGLKPSFCIGGEVPSLGGVADWGTGKNIVVEADESDGTLAFYEPSIAVITNIEFDHAEHFQDFRSLKKCFAQMVKGTRRKVVYCFDDSEARKIIGKFQNAVSYGFSSGANLRLTEWKDDPSGLTCRVELDGKALGKINLPVPGRHNALNAAAACAVGLEIGLPFAVISRALSKFQPVARRFARIVERKDLLVISDYAHHPSEVAALLNGVRALKRNRWLAVFQPHRYSRTRALGNLFPAAFNGVNELVLCPVYEASEAKIPGGTSWDLYEHFRQYGEVKTVCARSLRQAWDYLKTRATPGDGILIIGAGDVAKIGEWAKTEIGQRMKSALAPAAHWQNGLKHLRLRNSSVRHNEPMALKTTLRVGGSADIYIEAGDINDLALIIRWGRKNNVPVKVLGAGSNLLVSDLGVRGIVLRLKGPFWRNIRRQGAEGITAGAGISLQKLSNWAAQHGLSGAEFLAGIPGTIGGAIRMNAGAFGRETGDIIDQVKIMEKDGTLKTLTKKQLGFSYRNCKGLKNRIVVEAALRLKKAESENIYMQIRRVQKQKQRLKGLCSAGSIFKNPKGGHAGRLIESLGLKGMTIGGTHISGQHANIIITNKGARASDVLSLIEIIRFLVRMKRGINLEREVEYWE